MTSSNFWTGRNVVVTGGRGFLGSAVLRALAARDGARVSAPTSEDFDLRRREDADAMVAEQPEDKPAAGGMPGGGAGSDDLSRAARNLVRRR